MTESVTPHTKVRAADDAISTNVDGEEVILNLETDTYHGLNYVGSEVWALVQETREVKNVTNTLSEEYDIDDQYLAKPVS